MLWLEFVMLVWHLHGSGGWLVAGILIHFLLLLMTVSRCVLSKVILHGCIVSNRDRIVFAAPMKGMVQLAAVALVSTVTGWDAVIMILTVMDVVTLRVIDPSAQIYAVNLSFLMHNAMHVSILGMRLPAVTCWQLLCFWITMSGILFLTTSAAV